MCEKKKKKRIPNANRWQQRPCDNETAAQYAERVRTTAVVQVFLIGGGFHEKCADGAVLADGRGYPHGGILHRMYVVAKYPQYSMCCREARAQSCVCVCVCVFSGDGGMPRIHGMCVRVVVFEKGICRPPPTTCYAPLAAVYIHLFQNKKTIYDCPEPSCLLHAFLVLYSGCVNK